MNNGNTGTRMTAQYSSFRKQQCFQTLKHKNKYQDSVSFKLLFKNQDKTKELKERKFEKIYF